MDDLIGAEVESSAWKKYANKEKRSMHYSDEVRCYEKELEDEIFEKAGSPYNNWHKQGFRWICLDKMFK